MDPRVATTPGLTFKISLFIPVHMVIPIRIPLQKEEYNRLRTLRYLILKQLDILTLMHLIDVQVLEAATSSAIRQVNNNQPITSELVLRARNMDGVVLREHIGLLVVQVKGLNSLVFQDLKLADLIVVLVDLVLSLALGHELFDDSCLQNLLAVVIVFF